MAACAMLASVERLSRFSLGTNTCPPSAASTRRPLPPPPPPAEKLNGARPRQSAKSFLTPPPLYSDTGGKKEDIPQLSAAGPRTNLGSGVAAAAPFPPRP